MRRTSMHTGGAVVWTLFSPPFCQTNVFVNPPMESWLTGIVVRAPFRFVRGPCGSRISNASDFMLDFQMESMTAQSGDHAHCVEHP